MALSRLTQAERDLNKQAYTAGDWVYQGGTTRQYRNVWTGQLISRRVFDEDFGRIARQGLGTYERQVVLRKSRYHGFYQEQFDTFQGMFARIRQLGHKRGFVSMYGTRAVAWYGPNDHGWASTGAWFLDQKTYDQVLQDVSFNFDEIDTFWLRWK